MRDPGQIAAAIGYPHMKTAPFGALEGSELKLRRGRLMLPPDARFGPQARRIPGEAPDIVPAHPPRLARAVEPCDTHGGLGRLLYRLSGTDIPRPAPRRFLLRWAWAVRPLLALVRPVRLAVELFPELDKRSQRRRKSRALRRHRPLLRPGEQRQNVKRPIRISGQKVGDFL